MCIKEFSYSGIESGSYILDPRNKSLRHLRNPKIHGSKMVFRWFEENQSTKQQPLVKRKVKVAPVLPWGRNCQGGGSQKRGAKCSITLKTMPF